jgi:hypothetical protein
MVISNKKIGGSDLARPERIFSQGQVEKAFPGGPHTGCTARVSFDQQHGWQGPDDNGFALRRGLFAGALAEHELTSYAAGGGFSVGLGEVANDIMKSMSFGRLDLEHQHELRNAGIEWVRRWQEQFPQDDGEGGLDLSGTLANLMQPQTDLFVRRPERFAIRVRPDHVIGVGSALVAWEWSTAKNPEAISQARFALNHHALLRERLRRPGWAGYTSIKTRVEMLALGVGFTVSLTNEEAEGWRVAIGNVAEDLLIGTYQPNRGPHCSLCPWQTTCWFANDEGYGEAAF